MSILRGGVWGYDKRAIAKNSAYNLDDLVQYVANCVVRNMTYLLNVTPDRHGVIPEIEQRRLGEMGAWLQKTGDAIYGTRGGPWEPVDGRVRLHVQGRHRLHSPVEGPCRAIPSRCRRWASSRS